MKNNANQSTEQDGLCIVWQPILRTVFTKDDIAAIVAAIRANEGGVNVVPSAVISDGA